MGKGSKVLDRELRELLAPLGFVKMYKNRMLVRLVGDGVFQYAHWEGCPGSENGQDLYWGTDTIFQNTRIDRIRLFKTLDEKYKHFLDFEKWHYLEFLPGFCGENTQFKFVSFKSEDEQLDTFIKYAIPILKDCDSQEKLFKFHDDFDSYMRGEDRYKLAVNDLNLCLYFKKADHAIKIIDSRIAYIEETLDELTESYNKSMSRFKRKCKSRDFLIESYNDRKSRDNEDIAYLQSLRSMIDFPNEIAKYLEECKNINLQNFNKIMKDTVSETVQKYLKTGE